MFQGEPGLPISPPAPGPCKVSQASGVGVGVGGGGGVGALFLSTGFFLFKKIIN